MFEVTRGWLGDVRMSRAKSFDWTKSIHFYDFPPKILYLKVVLAAACDDDVVYLEHHPAKLCCEEELLALANEGVDDKVLAHVVRAGAHGIDTEAGVVFPDLAGFDGSEGFDGGEARVLGERHGDVVEGEGESAHGVLLDAGGVVGGVRNGERACNLGGSSSVHDAVVLNQVADNAEGVVERTLGLVNDL